MVNVTVTSGGTSGPRGSGWLSGSGAPSASTGFDGDFYLDTTNTGVYYGPKTSGAWTGPFNFGPVANTMLLTGTQTAAGDKTFSGYTTLAGGQANGAFTVLGAFETEGNLGFYGTTPIAKPTVTGSRGGNAALASLLTALASLGLIVDNTTA